MSGRIVVGVDDSEESRAALQWALEEARLRGAELTVVHAWTHPPVARGLGESSVLHPVRLLRQNAEKLLETIVEGTVDATPGVVVTRAAVEGTPAAALVGACRGADLLVVGSRGRGGFAGLMLGSVSRRCAEHAPCPVVIVRRRNED